MNVHLLYRFFLLLLGQGSAGGQCNASLQVPGARDGMKHRGRITVLCRAERTTAANLRRQFFILIPQFQTTDRLFRHAVYKVLCHMVTVIQCTTHDLMQKVFPLLAQMSENIKKRQPFKMGKIPGACSFLAKIADERAPVQYFGNRLRRFGL